MTSQKTRPSIIWMSTREIGIAAAFGGLAFVSVALGMVIPILPGGASVYALQGLFPIAAVAGGPIVGVLANALGSTPRPFWLGNWFIALGEIPFCFSLVPFRKKSRTIRLIWSIVMDWFWNWAVFGTLGIAFFFAFVYNILPGWSGFWTLFWLGETLYSAASIIIEGATLAVAFALFPHFMEMKWWDRWKEGRAAQKAWDAQNKK